MLLKFMNLFTKPFVIILILFGFGIFSKLKLWKYSTDESDKPAGPRMQFGHYYCHSEVCPNEYKNRFNEVDKIQTIDDFFEKLFIINLERSTKRKLRMERQLKRFRVKNYEFFKAIDGRLLNQTELRKKGVLDKVEEMYVNLTDGEIACVMSHASVWKEIIDRNYSSAMICEDDAKLMARFNLYMTLSMRDMPEDWGMIHWYTHKLVPRLKVTGNIYVGEDENGGAVCYSVKRHVAEYLYQIAFPINRAADGITNWPSLRWNKDRFRTYVVLPPIIWHWPRQASTIDEVDMEKNRTRH